MTDSHSTPEEARNRARPDPSGGAQADPRMAHDAERKALDPDPLGEGGELGDDEATGSDDGLTVPKRWRAGRRSPWISLVVMGLAGYLLVTMWSDFRYWTSGDDPVELGDVGEMLDESGRLPSGLENQFVALEGTPDVQNAMRLESSDEYVGYRRVTEAGGRLFAAVPRSKDEPVINEFAGRFVGRMIRLHESPAFAMLDQFFDIEKVTQSIDVKPEALVEALAQGADSLEIRTEAGPVTLDREDRIRLVTHRPDARVQLGKESFSTTDADQAIAALGYPHVRTKGAPAFHAYVVRIPLEKRAKAQSELLARLQEPPAEADPRQGAIVLPMTATFTTPASSLTFSDGSFVFPLGDNTTAPGYEVVDGLLQERALRDGTLEIPLDQLEAVRLEKPIELDPDGYLVIHGATPSYFRAQGFAWLLVLAIGLGNLLAIVLWWRRRR